MLTTRSKRSLLASTIYLILVVITYIFHDNILAIVALTIGFIALILPYWKKKIFNITLFYALFAVLIAINTSIVTIQLSQRPIIILESVFPQKDREESKIIDDNLMRLMYGIRVKNTGDVPAKFDSVVLKIDGIKVGGKTNFVPLGKNQAYLWEPILVLKKNSEFEINIKYSNANGLAFKKYTYNCLFKHVSENINPHPFNCDID